MKIKSFPRHFRHIRSISTFFSLPAMPKQIELKFQIMYSELSSSSLS